MAAEKRLIDTNGCPCIKCDRLGKCRPGFCEAFAEWWLSPVDAVEVSKLGKLGQLMMPYNGCPRGRIGKRGAPGDGTDTPQLMELDAIVDIDGNRWVPVLADDLDTYKEKTKEVVHGRWEKRGKHNWVCSACEIGVPYSFTDYHYCPNCGAKMDGDGNG